MKQPYSINTIGLASSIKVKMNELHKIFFVFLLLLFCGLCNAQNNTQTGNDNNNTGNQIVSKYQSLIDLGTEIDKKDNFDSAILVFSAAIKIEPNNPLGYDKRGFSYLKKRKYNKSIDDFDKALKLDSKYVNAYIHRGLVFMNNDNYILSVPDFDKAIELDPNNARAYFYRGMVKLRFQDVENAYSDLKKASNLQYDEAEDAIWKYCTDQIFIVPKDAKKDAPKENQ